MPLLRSPHSLAPLSAAKCGTNAVGCKCSVRSSARGAKPRHNRLAHTGGPAAAAQPCPGPLRACGGKTSPQSSVLGPVARHDPSSEWHPIVNAFAPPPPRLGLTWQPGPCRSPHSNINRRPCKNPWTGGTLAHCKTVTTPSRHLAGQSPFAEPVGRWRLASALACPITRPSPRAQPRPPCARAGWRHPPACRRCCCLQVKAGQQASERRSGEPKTWLQECRPLPPPPPPCAL